MSTKKDEQLAAPKPVLDVFWAANCSKNQQTLIPNTHPPAGWRILCLDPGWLAIPVGAAQRQLNAVSGGAVPSQPSQQRRGMMSERWWRCRFKPPQWSGWGVGWGVVVLHLQPGIQHDFEWAMTAGLYRIKHGASERSVDTHPKGGGWGWVAPMLNVISNK